MKHPYNAHLKIDEKRLWVEMEHAYTHGNYERYNKLKRKWAICVERQMANIERHETQEHIDKMWANNKHHTRNIIRHQ